MSETAAPIMRPNGKPYRPRKVIAYPLADDDEIVTSVLVLGTHDYHRAKPLADEIARQHVARNAVAVDWVTGWYRDGYVNGHLQWIGDEDRGRAGVWFREIVEAAHPQ